jgi:hypothetical protein
MAEIFISSYITLWSISTMKISAKTNLSSTSYWRSNFQKVFLHFFLKKKSLSTFLRIMWISHEREEWDVQKLFTMKFSTNPSTKWVKLEILKEGILFFSMETNVIKKNFFINLLRILWFSFFDTFPFFQIVIKGRKLKDDVHLYKNKQVSVNKCFERNPMRKEREKYEEYIIWYSISSCIQ